MSVSRQFVDESFKRLVEIDKRVWQGLFFTAIGLYTLAVVVEALGYSSAARLFPLVIGGPFLGLILLKLLLLLFADRSFFGSTELFDLGDQLDAFASVDVDPVVRYRREFVMLLWLAGVGALVWAIGFLPAMLVFVFSFITLYERDPVRAAVVTVVTSAFVYFFFVRLLGAAIYGGAFPDLVPGLPV